MVLSSILGFPRMGRDRELKKAVEAFWAGKIDEAALQKVGADLRLAHWQIQKAAGVDIVASADFSFYDHVMDHSVMFGAIPPRYQNLGLTELETYFAMGRGLQRPATENSPKVDVPSQEMVKWFDSNYHFMRPEFSPSTPFKLAAVPKPVAQFQEALAAGIRTRPVILGPVSLLYLGKAARDAPAGFDHLSLLDKVLPLYVQLLEQLAAAGCDSVQIDEPVLVFDLPAAVTALYRPAYEALAVVSSVKLTFTTYFGEVLHVADVIKGLPVHSVHIDVVRAPHQLDGIIAVLGAKQVLSVGIVDGRNVWKTNFQAALSTVSRAVSALGAERVIVTSSSSLLHTPHTLETETGKALTAEIKDWFAFAKEKCAEVALLAAALTTGVSSVQEQLNANSRSMAARSVSAITNAASVRSRQAAVTKDMHSRTSEFPTRRDLQQAHLKLPKFPTTTIGSFPQTKEIRVARDNFAKGKITPQEYEKFIEGEIRSMVAFQEEVGLDVFVHGEPERNDMVQYFLERMEGCTFTIQGWVQSYGSRCVRPPIIIGDVSRPLPMTVKESVYAASLTTKPMKGMLTGPLTCLRWSFPRDDLPLSAQCQQLALAIRDEVHDLEVAGINVIQIDEPALREGLPLRRQHQAAYLEWAVDSFRLATSCVKDVTQIHSHFCYSDFNEIFSALQALDADCITIESSKSDLKLLTVLEQKAYTSEIGPGVYDIHSPRVPSVEEMVQRIQAMCVYVKSELLWVNPDCGLKTRGWVETKAALTNMVEAAKIARKGLQHP